MQTECTPALFEFEPVERKKVVAGFDVSMAEQKGTTVAV